MFKTVLLNVVNQGKDFDPKVRRCLAQVIMGEKIYVWSTNKYSNELHTAVSVAFSVPSSVQSKNCWKTALIYSFIEDPPEGEELRDTPIGN